jgi:ABC-type Fe3+/spermidine/putrescine transport system ATPase subunit
MKISLQHLTKTYGDFTALNDVSFDVQSGEFFSILGRSGSGKTTLIRTIAGLEKLDGGSIAFDDHDVTDVPVSKRNAVMVFQNYALFPHLNVFENIAFGLQERRIDKAKIRETVFENLKLIDLTRKVKSRVSDLSGGEQQRVAIARALAVDANVILFDEPLSNLDVSLRRQTQIELRDLQRRTKKTFIYITHDQAEALLLSDRIAILNEGKLIEVGKPFELYNNPQTSFAASFIGSANRLDARVFDEDKLKIGNDMIFFAGRKLTSRAYDLVIRPEHILPLSQPTGTNSFKVKLIDRLFHGSFFEYRFIADGVEMTMHTAFDLQDETFVSVRKFFLFAKQTP